MKSLTITFCYIILFILINDLVDVSTSENVKKSIDDNREDNGEIDEPKEESMELAVETEPANETCSRRQNNLMHEIANARHKQFPFMAAIMSQKSEFLCSGSVVSNGMILTTAQCTMLPVRYVLLNTISDKKDNMTIMLHVTKSEKFPNYDGGQSLKDVGILYTEKHNSSVASKIRLSNYTNSRGIVDMEGIGFGLNADVGQMRELQYIGMENRPPMDSIAERDLLNAFFDCIDTKILTCFKDKGGPVIYDNELIGIVIKGQDECTKEISSTYAINKKMADVLPTYTFKAWLDERIKKNEEQEQSSLVTYPLQPILREQVHKMTAKSGDQINNIINCFVLFLSLILIVR